MRPETVQPGRVDGLARWRDWPSARARLSHRVPGGPLFVLGLMLVAAAVVISRRPDAVTNPQFFAEDGLWYSQAYNSGALDTLLWPYAGYLQVLPRLVASISLAFPLAVAPALFAWVAIAIQVLPVGFLASDRLADVIPRRSVRLAVAAIYLALPGTAELDANLTNAQWHLAILLAMILVARRATRVAGASFDVVAVVVGGLSGPFSVFLAPFAIIVAWRRRSTSQYLISGLLCATAAATLGVLVKVGPSERIGIEGITPELGLRALAVLGERVFLLPLIGSREAVHLEVLLGPAVMLVVLAGGVVGMWIALRQVREEIRLLLVFSYVVAIGSLVVVDYELPAILDGGGARYWLIPMLGWMVAVLAIATARHPRWVRAGAVLLLVVFCAYGVPHDWLYPAMPNQHFGRFVQSFDSTPRGASLRFSENPSGWGFVLTKH